MNFITDHASDLLPQTVLIIEDITAYLITLWPYLLILLVFSQISRFYSSFSILFYCSFSQATLISLWKGISSKSLNKWPPCTGDMCVFTWVNKVVFCPEMTFNVCCPCAEDVLTPSVPWTTDPVVSCFPDVWGDGWPTKNVPYVRNK